MYFAWRCRCNHRPSEKSQYPVQEPSKVMLGRLGLPNPFESIVTLNFETGRVQHKQQLQTMVVMSRKRSE